VNPAVILAQRFLQAQKASSARDLYREIMGDPAKYLKPENRGKLQELAQAMKNGSFKLDAKDPLYSEFQRLLGGVEKSTGQELPPELRTLIEQYRADAGTPSPAGPGSSGPRAEIPPNIRGEASPPEAGRSPPPAQANPREERSTRERTVGDWFIKQAESMAERNVTLRHSPALLEAIGKLTTSQPLSASGPAGTSDKTWQAKIAEFIQKAAPEKWSNMSIPQIRDVPGLSMLARLKLPEIRLPQLEAAAPVNQPPASAPSASAGTSLTPFLVAILMLLCGWFAYRRLAKRLAGGLWGGGKATSSRAWRLGPWPVKPDRVATREDLVLAFEHLSLLKLGPQAKVWNHLSIADRLSAGRLGQRSAAWHLARSYEQARYAPAAEALPEQILQTARDELNLLARAHGT
jgi:hypothetical protein